MAECCGGGVDDQLPQPAVGPAEGQLPVHITY